MTPDEIYQMRMAYGWSQEELAARIGLQSSSSISRLETGRHKARGSTMKLLEQLAAKAPKRKE